MTLNAVQTLFLGASITKFSSKVGYNGDSSELQVELVEDKDSHAKVYYDGSGYPQTHYGPDFFNPPQDGSCVYFRYGNFSFAGILQNWQQRKSTSGIVYTVRVVSPALILEATKVILGAYNATTMLVPNVINCYGYLEEFGTTNNAPLTAYVPTNVKAMLKYLPAEKYGGALRNELGIPWYQVKEALCLIINGMSWDIFRTGQYKINRASNRYGSVIQFANSNYMLDLSELPAIDNILRFSEDNMSLMEIISKVCEYLGCAFYLETILYPTTAYDRAVNPYIEGSMDYINFFSGHIYDNVWRWIKIRVVEKKEQPLYASNVDGAVGSQIEDRLDRFGSITAAVDQWGLAINQNSRGIELRDDVTNAFLVGDYRNDMYQVFYNPLTFVTLSGEYNRVADINNPKYIEYRNLCRNINSKITNRFLGATAYQDLTMMFDQVDPRNYTADNNDYYSANIWYYWGKDDDGFPVYSSGVDAQHVAYIPISGKVEQIVTDLFSIAMLGSLEYPLTAAEALCALVDKSSWVNFVTTSPMADTQLKVFYNYINKDAFSTSYVPAEGMIKKRLDLDTGQLPTPVYFTADEVAAGLGSSTSVIKYYDHHRPMRHIWWNASAQADALAAGKIHALDSDGKNRVSAIDQMYNLIAQTAQTYYGKKFLVDLPWIQTKYSSDNPYQRVTNYELADAGWSDFTVLGLSNDSSALSFFRDAQTGKIYPFLYFECPQSGINLDLSNIPKEDYIINNATSAYIKCSLEEIIWTDPVNCTGPKAVIALPGDIHSQKLFIKQSSASPIAEYHTLDWKKAALFTYGNRPVLSGIDMRAWGNLFRFGVPGSDKWYYPMKPFPLLPGAAAIPLRDKTNCYGPWVAYQNQDLYYGPNGRTDYSRDEQLNPWNCGSTLNMESAGQILVQTKTTKQGVAEVGSVTVPGAPIANLGDILITNGPNVTSIDVNFGLDGITTSYQFRSYTPDYNSMAHYRIQAFEKNARFYNKLKIMGDKAQQLEKNLNKAVSVPGITALTASERYDRHSSHDMLIAHGDKDYLPSGVVTRSGIWEEGKFYTWAEYTKPFVDFGTTVNSCVITDLRKGLPEFRADERTEYLTRAGMETIGMFRPFTTLSGSLSHMAEMPVTGIYEGSHDQTKFVERYGYYDTTNCLPQQGNGPIKCGAQPPICVTTLFPFLASGTSPGGFSLSSGSWGHDIEYILRNDTFPAHLSIHQFNDYSEHNWYRGVGLRGPLIVVGWGYDMDGRPVPNSGCDAKGRGTSAFFEKDWLRKPHKWKAGPVDLRWDYDRGVWSAPNYSKMYRVQFLDEGQYIPDSYDHTANFSYTFYGSGLYWAKVIHGGDERYTAYNPDGSGITPIIRARNVAGYPIFSGLMGWVSFNPSYSGITNYEKYDIISADNPAIHLTTTKWKNWSTIDSYQTLNHYLQYSVSGVNTINLPDVPGFKYTGQLVWYSGLKPVFSSVGTPTFICYGNITSNAAKAKLRGYDGVDYERDVTNWLNIPTGVSVLCTWVNDSWVITNASTYETQSYGIV